MEPEEILRTAANTALAHMDTDGNLAVKLLENTVKMHADDLLPLLDTDDEPRLLLSVDFEVDGKWRDGCILTLQDRAIIGWYTGGLRIKTFTRTLPYAEISSIEEEQVEPATRLQPRTVTLALGQAGAGTLRIKFFSSEDDQLDTSRLLQGVLSGAVSFPGEDDELPESPAKDQPV